MLLMSFLVYGYNFLFSIFSLSFRGKLSVYFIYFPLFLILSWYGAENIKELSVDYDNYIQWFDYIYYGAGVSLLNDKDPGFQLFLKFIQSLLGNDYFYIYFIFIFLSLFLKLNLAVDILKKNLIPLFLILCFSRYYILHDLNQFRASIAIVFITYFSLKLLKKDIGLLLYLILSAIAISVHSSVFFIFLIFFVNYYFSFLKSKYLAIGLVVAGVALYPFSQKILQNLGAVISSDFRYGAYVGSSGGYEEASISIFSFFVLVKILILVINFLIWDYLDDLYRKMVTLSSIGLFLILFFSNVAVIGWRFSELFAYFDWLCLLSPLIFLKLKMDERVLYIMALLVLSILMLYSGLMVVQRNLV